MAEMLRRMSTSIGRGLSSMAGWHSEAEAGQEATATIPLQEWLLSKKTPRASVQLAYQSLSTKDLRTLCVERNLEDTNQDLKRAEMIDLLIAEDNRNTTWVETTGFEVFFLFIILVNAVVIGWQIDNPDAIQVNHLALLNVTFLIFFMVEIVLKVHALGWRRYIKDYWNVFDLTVTFMASVQMGSTYIILGDVFYQRLEKYVAADCVQILRLCRLLRFARVFPELGRLIRSFLMSLKALYWIFLLLLLWFYLSGCFATVFIGRRELLPSEDHDEVKELRLRFATIPLSMFALFEVMTLEGWPDYVRPLLHSRPLLVAFFLAFIFVTAFFMLNLVTAVIVDRTRAAQDEELEWEAREAQLKRKVHIGEICQELRQESGTAAAASDADLISHQDFDSALRAGTGIEEALHELGWSKRYLASMFNCMDQTSDGRTSISSLQKFLEISDKPLDTASYMRFQLSLSHRLEHQEQLILKVLGVLEGMTQQKLELPLAEAARLDPNPDDAAAPDK